MNLAGITFSADGLKMFILDFENHADNKDVNEYDLTCGFGVINVLIQQQIKMMLLQLKHSLKLQKNLYSIQLIQCSIVWNG